MSLRLIYNYTKLMEISQQHTDVLFLRYSVSYLCLVAIVQNHYLWGIKVNLLLILFKSIV